MKWGAFAAVWLAGVVTALKTGNLGGAFMVSVIGLAFWIVVYEG